MPRLNRIIQRCRTLALAALLLSALPLCAQDVSKQAEADRGRPKKSTTGAVFRSLAVPGWGQYYTKSYWKAAGFLVVEGGLIWGISYQNDQMQAYRRSAENYQAAGMTATANDYRRFEYYRRDNRNELIWWLVGVTMLSMGDAYVDAQLYGVDMSPSLSLEHGTVGVTVSCKF
jgi:hypothetical protein